MDTALLLIEVGCFLSFSWILFERERIYGFYFFSVLVYAVFAQIGYLYFPELSVAVRAYFGVALWRTATIFILLSGALLFVFLRYFSQPAIRALRAMFAKLPVRVYVSDARWRESQYFALAALNGMLLLQYYILITRHDSLNWVTVQSETLASADRLVWLFMVLIKLSVGTNIALYCSARPEGSWKQKKAICLVTCASLVSFLLFTFTVGSRTDVVALGCGILIFEAGRIRIRVRHLAALAMIALTLYFYLQTVEQHRDKNAGAGLDPIAVFLLNDYYAPAHILFASMAYQYILPGEVIASNAANSLMMLNHPYLQAGITDIFNPGVATRSAGYAFYIFSEGYMFAGFLGFVYNGIVIGTLLSFWRALATTRSGKLNSFILALIGTMLVNVTRGQSSYFIKIAYSFFLPVTVLYLLLNQQTLRVKTSLPVFRQLLAEPRALDTSGGGVA